MQEKKKSSCGCCFLKVVGVFVVLSLIAGGIIGYFSIQTVKWVESAQESAPTAYAPLNISAGEQQDVDRVVQRINTAKTDKSIIDETITPAVFNGVVDKIIRGEKEKGKNPEFETFRGGIVGDHFTVSATQKVTSKTGEQKYVNVAVTFDCEIEDGHFNKLSAEKIVAGGKEAPFAVRTGINFVIEAFKKGVNDNTSPEAKKFKGFKLVKREGERVHIVLDPAKFDQPDSTTPAPKPEGTGDPKKDAF